MRHEYYEGEVFAMAGASITHNLVKGNLIASLRIEARKRGCRVLDENVRLVLRERTISVNPGVMLTCDPADRRDTHAVRHPVLIAEVLLPGTADYDRTEKFATDLGLVLPLRELYEDTDVAPLRLQPVPDPAAPIA